MEQTGIRSNNIIQRFVMKKRVFFFNAVLLTASALLLRTMNISYRVYLTGKIGAEGMGLYQLVFSVFVLAITISTSGISLAVTRMVSEAIASQRTATVRSAVRKCLLFSGTLSLAAMAAMFLSADWVGNAIVGDPRIISSLKILAPGLPFMALCACLKGYFLAVRGVVKSAAGEILEQVITIGVTVVLFSFFAPQGVEAGCCAIMIGSTVGEVASFLYIYLMYRLHLRRLQGKHPSQKSTSVLHNIVHIALPITVSSTLRSGLVAVENLLIPVGFRKYGASSQASLQEYGMIQGMVMPILYFPSSFLIAFSSLLIPEMSEANARGHSRFIQRATSRSFQLTLLFSMFITAVFVAFSHELGMAFYQDEHAGRLLRLLAPLVPLFYLDSVVDGILKGLDQQLHSMKYNFADSSLRVLLIFFLIPHTGSRGYLCVIFFSTIFNATLSIHRLMKVAEVNLRFLDWIVKPALCGALSTLSITLLARFLPAGMLPDWLLCTLEIGLSALLYYALLRLSGSFRRCDRDWIRSIFQSGKHRPAASAE